MIRISIPTLKNEGGRTYMVAHVVDEKQSVNEDIWYSTPEEYGKYFTPELSDAFLVGALMPAVYQQEDIVVEGAVTESLYHNITETIAPLIQNSFDITAKTDGSKLLWGGICLNINKLQNIKFDSFAVATGCSLGIDSFSTIEKYTAKDCSIGYKLTHLSFFNAGAYGSNNLEKARIAYEHDLKLVKEFGREMGLPVVEIETNFAVLYNKILPHYGDSGYIRNMSIVLSMQKLFKRYMYASSYQVNDLKHGFGSHFYLLSQLLSTLSTNITISLPIQTRTDKTKMILDAPLSYKYLNVCWGYLNIDEGFADIEKVKEKYLNCCRCDKCLRTLLTIDIMGYKEKYASIFDVKEYERVKNRYMGKVLALKDKAQFPKEIYLLMQQQHTHIPLKARVYMVGYRLGLHSLITKVKKLLIH